MCSVGEGASSFVKKVEYTPSGDIMELKVLKPSKEKDSVSNLCRELSIMRFSYSPFFLEFYGATVYVLFDISVLHIGRNESCDVDGIHGSRFIGDNSK